MTSRSIVLLLFASLAMTSACKGKESPAEGSLPRQKSKEEALQVFEKHRETYVRCEKLRLAQAPKSTEGTGKSALPINIMEAQKCQMDYWKRMKEDMGPYEQAKVDEWYSEWQRGVKIE